MCVLRWNLDFCENWKRQNWNLLKIVIFEKRVFFRTRLWALKESNTCISLACQTQNNRTRLKGSGLGKISEFKKESKKYWWLPMNQHQWQFISIYDLRYRYDFRISVIHSYCFEPVNFVPFWLFENSILSRNASHWKMRVVYLESAYFYLLVFILFLMFWIFQFLNYRSCVHRCI